MPAIGTCPHHRRIAHPRPVAMARTVVSIARWPRADLVGERTVVAARRVDEAPPRRRTPVPRRRHRIAVAVGDTVQPGDAAAASRHAPTTDGGPAAATATVERPTRRAPLDGYRPTRSRRRARPPSPRARRCPPGGRQASAGAATAPLGRTSPTWSTRGRSSSTARSSSPPSAKRRDPRRPDHQHARRRDDRRDRHGQRRPVRRSRRPRRSPCRTTTWSWPAPRATATTTRRTVCSRLPSSSGCRSCSYTEGGGGRPGDTERAERDRARLPGFPLVRPALGYGARSSVSTSGYCFAGNAAILGCCDVVIATAGLEHRYGRSGDDRRWRSRRVRTRPRSDRSRCSAPTASSTSSPTTNRTPPRSRSSTSRTSRARSSAWTCPDQTELRDVVPSTGCAATTSVPRSTGMFDTGSVLELRREFGVGMITALARIEGRPVGVIANNPGPPRRCDRRPTAPTRRPASCSSATPTASRS